MRPISKHAGFSLVEMIIVITIVGIVGSMVAVFMRAPIESYVAQDRRARLTDTADTALRRMARDVRLALPNSVRVTTVGGVVYLEFLATRTGGRYRTQIDPAVAGSDPLNFEVADNGFDVLGPAVDMRVGDLIAVYNLGIFGADAWAVGAPGDTLAAYTGGAGPVTTIAIAATLFPLASPGNRFQVVDGPVTYACAPNPANPALGTLTRFWGYARAAAQPTPPAAPALSALLATRVSACNFNYLPGVTERGGLLSMTLNLSQDNETVRLYTNMQVENQP